MSRLKLLLSSEFKPSISAAFEEKTFPADNITLFDLYFKPVVFRISLSKPSGISEYSSILQ